MRAFFVLGSKSGSSESVVEKNRHSISVRVALGRWEHCGVSMLLVLFFCGHLVVDFGRLFEVSGVGRW